MVARIKLTGAESRRLPRVMSEVRRRKNSIEYEDEVCDLAFKFCLLGATNKQLATFLGYSIQTIELWIRDKTGQFHEAVMRGRDEADAQIVHGLYRRAIGYTLENRTRRDGVNAQGEFWSETVTHEHVPPDPGAAFKLLAVRQKDKWGVGAGSDDGTQITVRIEGGLPPAAT